MTATAPSAKPPAAAIYALTIERFRGITSLKWKPSRGVNVILGGGNVGKATILEAIALLLGPVNPTTLSDPDYHDRDIEAGFCIEAVLSLPASAGINSQMKPSWPWEWSGEEANVPSLEHDGKPLGEPVYRVRVRGTEDLELAYEIIQPDGSADSFPVALRRAIGLVRLSGDDRNDRDLRLVQGSALDRLLSDKGLRSRMASELAKNDVKTELTTEAQTALKNLDAAFKRESLPAGLDLAIMGGQGASIASMIGLTADRRGVQLPLASWGAGTRRLSALAIAEQNQGDAPITLVDEVERGLEPYRQRTLIEKLQTGSSQVFLTTHSPAAISAAATSAIWYVDHTGQIGPLDATKIAKHRKTDPEAFPSRLAIVAEGATELGFTTAILERAFGSVLGFRQRSRHSFGCARCGYRAAARGAGRIMECLGCGSTAVSERSERTAQGYRRFRCRACGKQFNERSAGVLNRTQYPSDVIALVVLRRLRYKLALRDLPEMFLIRGIVFSHEAVRDWETKLSPALAENLRRRRRGKAGRSWYVDETYIKVHGEWRYLYRAIDRSGALVDVMFSEHRDMAAAKAFFEPAKMVTGITPDRVTTDGHDSYPRATRTVLGTGVRHRDSQYLNKQPVSQ